MKRATIAIDHLTDAQRELLGGGGPPIPNPNMWGSMFVLPSSPAPPADPTAQTDRNFINLQFDEPTELQLEWYVDPPPDTGGPEIVCKAFIGNGRSAFQEIWDVKPAGAGIVKTRTIKRIVTAQSLQIAAHRIDIGNPDTNFHLWATRRVAGAAPVVIASEIVSFAAGVPTQTLSNPPADATYVQGSRDSATTNLHIQTFQAGGIGQRLLLYSSAIGNPLVALDPRNNQYRASRIPSVLAGEAQIQWLR